MFDNAGEALPPGWVNVPASALFSFVTSGSRGWAARYSDQGASFIRIQNVRRGRIELDLADVQRVRPPPEGAEGARTRLQSGDLAITITADLGRVGLVRDGLGEAYVNQHVALARPIDVCTAPYLAWYFTSPIAQEQLGLLNRGATRSGLGLEDIKAVKVALPPLPEQRRIVARIEALLARTRRARAEVERATVLAQACERSLFSSVLAEAAGVGWDEAGGQLPPGWAAATLGGLGTWVGGGTPSKSVERFWRNGTIPWVSPKDMKAERIGDAADHITSEAVAESATRLVPAGSVLMVVRSGILEHSLPVAVTTAEVAINQDLKALILAEHVEADFVALALNTLSQGILRDCSKPGTTVASVSLDRLKAFPFILPPMPEQRRIAAQVHALLARTRQAQAEAERIPVFLDRLDAATLSRALRGELVPQDPADEPATALLARLTSEQPPAPAKRRRAA